MTGGFLKTGVYLLGSALVPAIGLLLVCWGLWGDRSKGRQRCPRCWYDMRGTLPRLECPECGHDAGQERQLYRHHRRWRHIALGVVLVLASAYPLAVIAGPLAQWFIETGVYLLCVLLTPTVGLLLVAWGLWGSRSKGRARCPKCWHDMRPTLPQLTCPDCGHDAGHQRRLYRNHRRWGRIVIGVVLVLLSTYPLAITAGWCLEQAAHEWAGNVFVHESEAIGPDWLVGRLPDGFARFFDRLTSIRILTPTARTVPACEGLLYLREIAAHADTDAELVHLRGLSDLESLVLSSTQVTDAGLVHLKGFSDLEGLALMETGVTDAGLAHLSGLSNLKRLFLGDTRIGWMNGLQRPFVTQVTDAGLVHLKGLSNLEHLDLSATKVTPVGVADLKQALPDLEVVR